MFNLFSRRVLVFYSRSGPVIYCNFINFSKNVNCCCFLDISIYYILYVAASNQHTPSWLYNLLITEVRQQYCLRLVEVQNVGQSNLSILISLLVFPCCYIWVRTNGDMIVFNLMHKIARWTSSYVRGTNGPSNPIRIKKFHSHLMIHLDTY